MPEGPEVEKLKIQLNKVWSGAWIKHLVPVWDDEKTNKFFEPYSVLSFEKLVRNHKIERVERKGKWLLVKYNNDQLLFAFHLGFTGWVMPECSSEPESFPSHLFIHKVNAATNRFVLMLETEQGSMNWQYHDQRTWGRFILPTPVGVPTPWDHYGPDWGNIPHRAGRVLLEHEEKRKKTVKLVLTDPGITSGLGNYLVCESCFRAGVRPNAEWKSLTSAQRLELVSAIMRVVSLSTHRDDREWWSVFKRKGEPCKRECGGTIQYEKDPGGSRGTYLCPICQPK